MQRTQELPAELVKIIFEQCSQATLKDVSLACHRFRDIAQAILFRQISVGSEVLRRQNRQASKRVEFLRESPGVVKLIRAVQIWIGTEFQLKSSTDVLTLLQHETIQEFELGTASGVKTTVEFDNLVIKMCKSPCLRVLKLANYPPSHVLASIQPSLKHLRLVLHPSVEPSRWAQPERSLAVTLDSLGFLWKRPAPRFGPGTPSHQWRDVAPQVRHFLNEDQSKVDLRRLKSLQMPVQMGSGIGTGVHGVSECRAIVAQCRESLESISLVMECRLLLFVTSHGTMLMDLAVGDWSSTLPALGAWDTVLIGFEKLPRLQNLRVEATGFMEHILHWIYTQLREVTSEHNNALQTLDISIINRHLKTQVPYTFVWTVLDTILSDRKRFPLFRAIDIRLVQFGLWSLTVDPRVIVNEIVVRMPRLTKSGMLIVHQDQ